VIEYIDDTAGVSAADLSGFFAGWQRSPTPETHLRILCGSSHVVLAREAHAGRVIGFITAISDGVLSAYIPLLEVLPEYRQQGVGTELLKRMLTRLSRLYMVDLVCDPDRQAFYEAVGFETATAMIRRDYAQQGGRPIS
jgi:ribosomal protein S18 acetylase RimI-like enzyme